MFCRKEVGGNGGGRAPWSAAPREGGPWEGCRNLAGSPWHSAMPRRARGHGGGRRRAPPVCTIGFAV
eukprot:2741478-Pyramimonas_sp.AAC.1